MKAMVVRLLNGVERVELKMNSMSRMTKNSVISIVHMYQVVFYSCTIPSGIPCNLLMEPTKV